MNDLNADVIIVGGGPAGVAAALELRRCGIERVVILERERYLGGATRHCSHSPFGMREFGRIYFGAAYGRRLERQARIAQVDVRTGHSVVSLGDDGVVTIVADKGTATLSARRILVSTGAREMPRSARLVSGDRPVGIVTTGTLQSYVSLHGLMPFSRPLIVGSELVSLSAVLTCLSHRARPVAVIEPERHAIARAPFNWFPALVGIPFHCGADVVDIRGTSRVEAATVRLQNGGTQTISCDGILFTGRFTPEAALFLQSSIRIASGSAGPAVDQDGRTENPLYFASGNVLRAVETGGWAFCEGTAVGAAIASDLDRRREEAGLPVALTFDPPVKLVVPQILRRIELNASAFRQFQLRFNRCCRGVLSLELDGREVWRKAQQWMPERRVLVPIPDAAHQAQAVHFRFREE
ncbi:FAD-dependent oxidoreductase [Sinorhizobium meliloti]|uniref:FAD-dependent oxidoreductase n=1 Tax=Rhizobium meliloti TaxID=382 RepID=UPI00040599AB|nr:FAD-dependent oxidoreductase [Sinorhizobium meliloti]